MIIGSWWYRVASEIFANIDLGATSLSEPMLTVYNWTQWKFDRNSNIFIQEIAFENVVWKMSAILFRPKCVEWDNYGLSLNKTLSRYRLSTGASKTKKLIPKIRIILALQTRTILIETVTNWMNKRKTLLHLEGSSDCISFSIIAASNFAVWWLSNCVYSMG